MKKNRLRILGIFLSFFFPVAYFVIEYISGKGIYSDFLIKRATDITMIGMAIALALNYWISTKKK